MPAPEASRYDCCQVHVPIHASVRPTSRALPERTRVRRRRAPLPPGRRGLGAAPRARRRSPPRSPPSGRREAGPAARRAEDCPRGSVGVLGAIPLRLRGGRTHAHPRRRPGGGQARCSPEIRRSRSPGRSTSRTSFRPRAFGRRSSRFARCVNGSTPGWHGTETAFPRKARGSWSRVKSERAPRPCTENSQGAGRAGESGRAAGREGRSRGARHVSDRAPPLGCRRRPCPGLQWNDRCDVVTTSAAQLMVIRATPHG